jgi:serine/threonine protein kinase
MKHGPTGFDARAASTGRGGSRIGSTVLGSFHLLGEIGVGSFGVAYLARQIGTERHAVVKIPHRHLMDDSDHGERIRSRFAAELRASTRVSHHNIAVVYTAGDLEGGVPAIAMEHVPGPMLAQQLAAAAPLSPPETCRLGCQIASALGAVHSAGIIHRDVSPRNIIASTDTDGNSRYVLLDFGIAKVDGLANRTAGMVGTPRYMAPEQIRGRAVPQSDMFGLGAILWWALTAEKYLAGTSKLSGLLERQLDQREPPDPRHVRPSIPASVARLVSQLLHPEPEQRPGARAFAEAWMRAQRDWIQSCSPEPAGADARVAPAPEDRADTTSDDDAPVVSRTLDSTAETQTGNFPVTEATTTLEHVLGVMPEWLQDLREAVRRDDAAAIVQVSTRIADHARLSSAGQLARLSEILAGLAEDGILDQATGFLREIEAEFHRWFRELLDARQRSR